MSVRTYMGVDQRHDHSFRIPRPDESVKFGTPNACNDCHTDKTAAWAAKSTDNWYGPNHQGFQQYAGTLTAARTAAANASSLLVSLAKDEKAPNIAKATALVELQPYLDVNTYAAARANLNSADPLLRTAAVELIAAADPATRWRMLSPLLADPIRAVRITAVSEIVDAIPEDISPADKATFDKALGEFIAVQQFDGDRPEAHLTLGNLYVRQGKTAEAESEYNTALKLDPDFIPAYVNMADLMRAGNRDGESERWLLEAQKKVPKSAEVAYSLGLLRARQHRTAEALPFLENAARLAPENPHYAYVYGVGLYSAGQRPQGISFLEKATERFPGNREILLGTASLCADAGDLTAAKAFAEKFRDVAPADPRGEMLLEELSKKTQPN
jgi:tetratricopeptide (TPR) repeat protein